MSGRVDKNLDLLSDSPFFEGVDPEHIEHFARLARTETFVVGDHIIVQGEPATFFYVLVEGKIELSFRKPGDEVPRNEEAGPEMEGQAPPHIVSHPGYPVGWASIVEPDRYRATAVARERTEMLVLSRDLFEQYTKEHPDFGLAFMRRVLAYRKPPAHDADASSSHPLRGCAPYGPRTTRTKRYGSERYFPPA